MAQSTQRKKPGYTKNGEVKIVSLNYKQCVDLLSKTGKKKLESKIRNRMQILASRKGFVLPVVAEVVEASE